MSLDPILYSTDAIRIHVLAAAVTVVLTIAIFCLARGSRTHRILGWAWVAAMAVVAVSSFGIYTIRVIGPFSPIHLLSAGVLIGLVSGVRAARGGHVQDHRKTMLGMVWGGLIIAGGFTFLPGRIMHATLFGG